jgi:hypothetical protein
VREYFLQEHVLCNAEETDADDVAINKAKQKLKSR